MQTIVILGASHKPERASHMLLNRLLQRGITPVLVHPVIETIAGIPVHRGLETVATGPDILTMYLNAARSTPLADQILRLAPRKVVFNPGAENPSLEARLNGAGIATENACSLILLSQGLFKA
jgi:predicted CoA-binding protein